MNKASICVYGPAKSGKSKNAKALANMYGLTKIDDELDRRVPVEQWNTLYLSQYPMTGVRSISIASALKMLELE